VKVGQGPYLLLLREFPELKREKRGNVIADAQFHTSLRKEYASGWVAIRRAIEILSMGAAKQAAYAIDRMLRDGRKTSIILIRNQFWRNVLGMI